jgi:hypothetical protein
MLKPIILVGSQWRELQIQLVNGLLVLLQNVMHYRRERNRGYIFTA